MRLSRLLLVLLVLALAWWVLTRSGLLSRGASEEGGTSAPIERARTAAAAASGRAAASGAAQREADAPVPSGSVSENMTPEQVRSLLGPPDETSTETTETGAPRERWMYRSVNKTVVFENGVVVRVE
ncbi:MAG TPA: hypothetical protein VEG84_00185 [Thermoanaerobaculia bacterium]|nr:hypothetical protein [Thermoanaerobaculia bacterium]